MKKWEYLCAYYSLSAETDILNKFGEDGWELISVIPTHILPNTHPNECRYFFKRQKIEKAEPDKGD